MEDYDCGPPKSIKVMSKEERLILGGNLVETKKLIEIKERVEKYTNINNENTYEVWIGPDKYGANIPNARIDTLTVSDSKAYTHEMQENGLDRCLRFRDYLIEILNERLAEIDQTLEQL